MQITATTPIACMLCLAILYLGPARSMILVFASLPFGSAAAVNLSGLGSIFMAELAMLTLGLSLLFKRGIDQSLFVVLHPRSPGFPLLLLMITTCIGAVFMPRVFAGQTDVFTLVRQADGATLALRPLQPTGSNLGQFFRFALAGLACVVGMITFMRFATAETVKTAILAASLVHISLSIADLIGPLIGFDLMAPFRNAYVHILDEQVMLGVRRLIGGFPEPSGFGVYTIGLYGFWLRLWFGAPRSKLASFMAIIMALLLVRSTSSAAIIGLSTFTLFLLLWEVRKIARNGPAVIIYAVLTFLIPVLIGVCVVAFQVVPVLSEFASIAIFDKMDSNSGVERMSWNLQAVQTLADTYGIGAGIGSVRASGWAFAVLGSIGFCGTLLYSWFIAATLFVRVQPRSNNDPKPEMTSALQSSCAAIFLLSLTVLPQPNLGLPFFLMAGMVAGLSMAQRADGRQVRPFWEPSTSAKFQTMRLR